MSNHLWLQKRPESVLDWLGIILLSIGFYIMLGYLDIFMGALGRILDILAPFATGIVLAYVLDCIVRPLQHKVMRDNPRLRWLSILIAYILAAATIGVLGSLVIPQVFSSVSVLIANIPGYINNLQDTILMVQDQYGVQLPGAMEMLESTEDVMGQVTALLTEYAPKAVAYVGGLASNVVDVFTAIASSIYMLAEKDMLLRQLRTLVHAFLPRPVAATMLDICSFANSNFEGFFVGKVIDSAIIGVMTFFSCLVLNISYAALIAVVVGVTNIIPVFGPFIGAIPCLVILLFINPWDSLKFLILIIVIQQIDGNFIGPKILGKSIGISALWVLFSIVLGGDLMGVVGMVLGVPVFATVYGLVRQFAHWCLRRRGIDAQGRPLDDALAETEEEEERETTTV